MEFQHFKNQIKQHISKNEIEVAFNLMTKHATDPIILDEIVLQSAMFHSLKKDRQNGVIDYPTQQLSLSNLRTNMLNFVKDLPREGMVLRNKEDTKNLIDDYKQSLGRICVIRILEAEQSSSGLSIKEIFERSKMTNRKFIHGSLNELEEAGFLDRKKGKPVKWYLNTKGKDLAKKLYACLFVS